MNILKQSTAATIKLGPFINDGDGKSAETGLTISQADIRLSKNGGDFAQTHNATGATHDELGYYNVPLDATDTGTLGRLRVAVSESGALPVWQDFLVVTANVYDTLCSTDTFDVNVATIATDAITAASLKADAVTEIQSGLATSSALATVDGIVDDILVDTSTTLDGKLNTIDTNVDSILADTGTDGVVVASGQTVATVTNLTNLPTMPADWVTASGLKADAVTEIQSGLALEATLTAIKGAGWTTETLKVIRDALTAAQADLDNPSQYKADVSGLMTDAAYTAPDNAGIAAIESKTNNLPTSPAPANEYDARMTAIQADLDNHNQYKADVSGLATQTSVNAIPTSPLLAANYTAPDNASIAEIKAKTDNLPASPAPANEYDTELTAIQADLDNPDQYKADVSALATTAHVQEVENKVGLIDVTTVANSGKIDAVDAKVSAIDTDTVMSFMIDGFTFEEIVQIMASVLAGKLTRSGDTLTFKDLADTVNRVVVETDENKQGTGITYTV